MKYHITKNLWTLILFVITMLWGCSPDKSDENLQNGENIPPEIAEKVDDLPLGSDSAGATTSNYEPLPANGIVEPNGPLSQFNGCPDVNCDCGTVQLAKMETKDFTGFSGWGILSPRTPNYITTVRYELGNVSNPPENGSFRFPQRDFRDMMCFYFTYPTCYAYWGREGGIHPCKVMVEIKWPTTRSSTGYFVNTWQLYGIRGVENFATGAKNFICYTSAPEGFEVTPGTGEIRWSVNGRICTTPVRFTVF